MTAAGISLTGGRNRCFSGEYGDGDWLALCQARDTGFVAVVTAVLGSDKSWSSWASCFGQGDICSDTKPMREKPWRVQNPWLDLSLGWPICSLFVPHEQAPHATGNGCDPLGHKSRGLDPPPPQSELTQNGSLSCTAHPRLMPRTDPSVSPTLRTTWSVCIIPRRRLDWERLSLFSSSRRTVWRLLLSRSFLSRPLVLSRTRYYMKEYDYVNMFVG